ncbi:conserved exported hypothetical protein [Alteromonas macleodii]|jgi:hypothetical protein|uniref:Lipoprotein n=1 Tax=Alteromonas macleodii TaxID=28108 RepID=A0AB36FW63_ALTMA|nr:hypothetical protein BFV95_1136 [Alteromonas macleodii]OES35303.1 hypothetical protein BFV94_1136 [Alteromonas macleodii]OES36356.1 hypothetical protein BFV93_1136 [Alteromonas macleodii]OES41543.1 hypothetical protein BFV96_1136 [Alteromonas macleodii]
MPSSLLLAMLLLACSVEELAFEEVELQPANAITLNIPERINVFISLP